MKKVLAVTLLLILTTACSKSPNSDLSEFQENINDLFNSEIMTSNDITILNENNEIVAHWTVPDKKIYCSFYLEENTCIIKKYTVSARSDNKYFLNFLKTFEKNVYINNKDIRKTSYSSDGYIIVVFDDIRYKKHTTALSLKHSDNSNQKTK